MERRSLTYLLTYLGADLWSAGAGGARGQSAARARTHLATWDGRIAALPPFYRLGPCQGAMDAPVGNGPRSAWLRGGRALGPTAPRVPGQGARVNRRAFPQVITL